MDPIARGRYFKTEGFHVTMDKLGGTGYGQTGLEFTHICGHEARKHALHRHTNMLSL